MDTSDTGTYIHLVLPSSLAYELMASKAAVPYLRAARADPEVISAVVAATTSAATTVVVTQLTQDAIRRFRDGLRRWLSRPDHEGKLELSIRSDGTSTTTTITLTTAVSEDDMMRLFMAAQPNGESPAGHDV